MKAILLYSGGKDSSLVAHLLKQLGYEITCVTANFGADPECVKVAGNVAKTFGKDSLLHGKNERWKRHLLLQRDCHKLNKRHQRKRKKTIH